MRRDEAEATKDFIKLLLRRTRMEYGMAMALEGFEPDVIIQVQRRVAEELSDWLAQ